MYTAWKDLTRPIFSRVREHSRGQLILSPLGIPPMGSIHPLKTNYRPGGTLPGPAGGGYPDRGGSLPGPARGATLVRYPPGWTWQGTPRSGYPPGWTWQGTPLDLAGYPPSVCPMAFWEMLQSIMGYGYPPPCGQTD